eukprot:1265569-Amphidinium_carterae.1
MPHIHRPILRMMLQPPCYQHDSHSRCRKCGQGQWISLALQDAKRDQIYQKTKQASRLMLQKTNLAKCGTRNEDSRSVSIGIFTRDHVSRRFTKGFLGRKQRKSGSFMTYVHKPRTVVREVASPRPKWSYLLRTKWAQAEKVTAEGPRAVTTA